MTSTLTRDLFSARTLSVLVALSLFAGIWFSLPARDSLGRPLPLSFLLGGAFGLVLQRSRFCFWCNARDFFERRDGAGLLAIVIALAAGTLGYAAILGAWLPNPFSGRLAPDAHIGPVSLTLVIGALAFGLGMAFSGSCISAHFYRLGEGSIGSIVALFGALAGFILGFLTWNPLYLAMTWTARPYWLPAWLGYSGTVIVQLAVLALLAWVLLLRRMPAAQSSASVLGAVFRERWSPVVAGLLVGAIATIAYLRVGPLGVTAELGSIARTGAATAGWLPETLLGLDGMAGCATVVKEALLSRNGVFVSGMVIAAFASARVAGQWEPKLPRPAELPRLFLGGLLLGWGAMVSLGCTVGVLMSGIMVGAVSGWVFLAFCLAGAWLGWRIRRALA